MGPQVNWPSPFGQPGLQCNVLGEFGQLLPTMESCLLRPKSTLLTMLPEKAAQQKLAASAVKRPSLTRCKILIPHDRDDQNKNKCAHLAQKSRQTSRSTPALECPSRLSSAGYTDRRCYKVNTALCSHCRRPVSLKCKILLPRGTTRM